LGNTPARRLRIRKVETPTRAPKIDTFLYLKIF
jgi:hypothetical protein